MRLAIGIVGGALLGALFAVVVWLVAFGNISVSDTPDDLSESITAPEPPRVENPPTDLAPPAAPGARLAIPVDGVAPEDLVDTYSQARASGERRHDAIDIMAPQGSVVLAAAPGTVEKLFYSEQGGITVYVRSRDRRWIYYYAHLDRYAPGLLQGSEVSVGDPLGLVGSTGNADSSAPHLHFAVMRMEEGEGWWEGEAVNPYPLLIGTN